MLRETFEDRLLERLESKKSASYHRVLAMFLAERAQAFLEREFEPEDAEIVAWNRRVIDLLWSIYGGDAAAKDLLKRLNVARFKWSEEFGDLVSPSIALPLEVVGAAEMSMLQPWGTISADEVIIRHLDLADLLQKRHDRSTRIRGTSPCDSTLQDEADLIENLISHMGPGGIVAVSDFDAMSALARSATGILRSEAGCS